MIRAAVSLALIAAAVAGTWLWVRSYRLPPPTGSYPVGTTILNLTDASRPGTAGGSARMLVVQLWYPAAASKVRRAMYRRPAETTFITRYLSWIPTHSWLDAPVSTDGAPFPVLLYGHRWGGERTQNTALAQDLASHGYVVAAIDHPGNSSRVLLGDGRVVTGDEDMDRPATASARIALWNDTLEVWAADDEFVLNQLARLDADPRSVLHGRLDTGHAGAFGHSFGGAAALRLCGRDPRIRGAVNLDGYSFGALSSRTAAQPVMIVYEQEVADRRQQLLSSGLPGTIDDQMDRADNAAVDANLLRFGGLRLYVQGAQHMDFSDQPLLPPLHPGHGTGPIAPGRADLIVRQTVLAFFDRVLRGKPAPALEPGAFREVTAH